MKKKEFRLVAALLVCILAVAGFMGCQVEGPDNKTDNKADDKGPLTNLVADNLLNTSRGNYKDPYVYEDSYEFDNNPSRAKRILTYGGQQIRNFRDDAVDWVWFDVKKGREYIIETNGDESIPLNKRADTMLYLYESNNERTLLAQNDDINSGYNRSSRIVYVPTESGRRYLKVTEYRGPGPDKNYTLSVIESKLLYNYTFQYGNKCGFDEYGENGGDVTGLWSDSNRLAVKVSNPGSRFSDVGVFRNGLKLEKGKTYTFLFDAKTETGEKNIYVKFEKSTSPWGQYCTQRYYRLNSSGMTTYSSTFTMNDETDNNVQFMIYLGKKYGDSMTYPAKFWIDNVRIYENR